jgi:hypothetical protein
MAVMNPDLVKSYMTERGLGLQEVEALGYRDPGMVSAAILHTHYKGGFWDSKFAHKPFPRELPGILRDTGVLSAETGGSTSTRGKVETYLTHFVSAIAAYGNPSRFLRVAVNSFGIDPGIKVRRINQRFPGDRWPSFWNAIGGDMLTDHVYGTADEDEYRAGLLGLDTLKTHPGGRVLSDMVMEAADKLEEVRGDKYKALTDFQIARDSIQPVYGHILIRWLTRNVGFLQRNALIPIERAYLT